LNSPHPSREGSPIWKPIKAAIPSLQPFLFWVPVNGKHVELQSDSKMGNQPLIQIQQLHPLKDWLDSQGKNYLYDISDWSFDGWWNG
jgi:hypothetical protein